MEQQPRAGQWNMAGNTHLIGYQDTKVSKRHALTN